MFLVFFAFVLAGLAVTQIFPAKAVATVRVLVSVSPEVSMMTAGYRSARILIRPSAAHLEVEKQLAAAPENAAAAITKIGVERLFPKTILAGEDTARVASETLERDFLADLTIEDDARSSVLQIRYAHPNGATAVEALEAYVDAYLARRNQSASLAATPRPVVQGASAEERLVQANRAILDFLDANRIGDLAGEIDAANGALAAISQSIVAVRASLSEARGRARELEAQIAETPEEIELFVEAFTTDRIAALESERDQMMARFGTEHAVIHELDRQIERARQMPPQRLEAGRARTGVNSVHQALATAQSNTRAEIAALERRAATLTEQRTLAESQRRSLATLEPEWRRLVRVRDGLEREVDGQVGNVSLREEAAAAQPNEPSPARLLQAASLGGSGISPMHAIAALFAGLGLVTAVAAGIVRALLRKGLPTPASAERTLGLRVLAAVGDR